MILTGETEVLGEKHYTAWVQVMDCGSVLAVAIVGRISTKTIHHLINPLESFIFFFMQATQNLYFLFPGN